MISIINEAKFGERSQKRWEIEDKEKWREWCDEIPSLNFKQEWNVKIVPPFGGALARFLVEYNGNMVSVFFDGFGVLGAMRKPYFEIYPWENDIKRYYINETDKMLDDIDAVLCS